MTHLVLVGCGAAKRDEPAAACDLYTSTYFALKREYAETVGDEWSILSAEHGLVRPSKVIEPYDTVVDDVDAHEWALNVRASLDAVVEVLRKRDQFDVTVTVLAGSSYVDPLRDGLDRRTFEVRYPFDETSGIGDQMGWLSTAVEERGQA